MSLAPHLPATELVAYIRCRALAPVEVLRGHLDRIARFDVLMMPTLPASLQFVAPHCREDLLLRLGRQFEQVRPWPIAPSRYC